MEGFSDPGIKKLAMDIRSDEEVQRVIAHILEVEGRIDVFVNNAGILGIGEHVKRK
jgi:1-acylglycerone phosphate reductase